MVVKGLHHADASDLDIRLDHNGHRASLTNGSMMSRQDLHLGRPGLAPRRGQSAYETLARSRTTRTDGSSEPASERDHNDLQVFARGTHYHFGDVAGANLALEGRACQSSTRFGGVASHAIDGDTTPYFSNGSVTHTFAGARPGGDPSPWWQVTLRRRIGVGTIQVFGRAMEDPLPEV